MKDLTGLGDLDIEDLDRRRREQLRALNPHNRSEVVLEMWTLAHLRRGDKIVRRVVYGVCTESLADDYVQGEIICSPDLYNIMPPDDEPQVYCSKRLRYECRGPGREITIQEEELKDCLSDPGADPADIRRRIEDGEI